MEDAVKWEVTDMTGKSEEWGALLWEVTRKKR
jgi:hypothetical protein